MEILLVHTSNSTCFLCKNVGLYLRKQPIFEERFIIGMTQSELRWSFPVTAFEIVSMVSTRGLQPLLLNPPPSIYHNDHVYKELSRDTPLKKKTTLAANRFGWQRMTPSLYPHSFIFRYHLLQTKFFTVYLIPVCRHVLSIHDQTGPYLYVGASSHIGILHDWRPGLGL